MAEKYPSHSPYNYTLNNPVKYIDPDGRSVDDVIITGNKKQKAFEELQAAVKGELSLSMDGNGKVTATKLTEKALSKGGEFLYLAITDSSVIVNIFASDNDFISDKSAPLLGNFMGNIVTPLGTFGEKRGGATFTYQEINPVALSKFDKINKLPGKTTLHEVVESYIGGSLSQSLNMSAGKATPADAKNENSIYSKSHRVIPQSGVLKEHFYNLSGTEIFRGNNNFNPVKLKYSTGNHRIFHTIPKEK